MRIIDEFLICDLPEIDKLNLDEIDVIVEHTHNTWQKDRSIEELRENTIQGKRAEFIVEQILRDNSCYRYLSYDSIRNDDYKKHAPFDGVIYSADLENDKLHKAIDLINSDVKNSIGDTGIIGVETRKALEDAGVFTIEIKSSLLQDPRDYKVLTHKEKNNRTEEDYRRLCEYIRGFYDYFVYPHYCRDSINISSFYEYTVFLRNRSRTEYGDVGEFLTQLMKNEFDNACSIYTRVFIDVLSDEIIVPGYIVKTRFFEEPRIQKMPSPKSRNAIYYMYHMEYGRSLIEIDQDDELRRFDRMRAYKKLFGERQPVCGNCGKNLKLRESTRNQKFLYLCEDCESNRWHTMNEIYPRNMKER